MPSAYGALRPVPLLQVEGLAKRYGNTQALAGLDLTLARGEMVGIVGENGAGKSTFAKILAGAVPPDDGRMRIDGERVSFRSPRDARQSGIALIPQELSFVPDLTVAENILLNMWPGACGLTSVRALKQRAQHEMDTFGIRVDSTARMADLRLADQQLVELLKALARRSSVLILDEPTATLSDQEAGELFQAVEMVKGHGVGVILISHRMDEVLRYCDRIDVFRNSRRVFTEITSRTDVNQIVTEMLGKAPEDDRSKVVAPPKAVSHQPVLELQGWHRRAHPTLTDVSLTVQPGEIVSLFGVRGSGVETLAEGLGGRRPDIRGGVLVEGSPHTVFRSPRAARLAGLAYVPPDRKREGLVIDASIAKNVSMMALQRLSSWGIISTSVERRLATNWTEHFGVRYHNLSQRVGQLSGGNQQKVLLASRLASEPKILVLQEPTRGVDIGARLQIHDHLRELTRRGTSVLVVTADVEEAVTVADRVLIMRAGRLVRTLSGVDKTQAEALRIAAGGTP